MAFKDFDVTKEFESLGGTLGSSLNSGMRSMRVTGYSEVVGIEQVEENLIKLMDRMVSKSVGGTRTLAHELLHRAKGYVPYRTGGLFGTGRVVEEVHGMMGKRGPRLMSEFIVTFGDTSAGIDYALLVHENPDGRQYVQNPEGCPPEYRDTPKISQYLTVAADEIQGKVRPTVARFVQEAVAEVLATVKRTPPPSSMAPRLVRR